MCTGIQLRTLSGAPIYGRTMEFANNLKSQLLVIPKETSFTGAGPSTGGIGKSWKSNYSITGLNASKLLRIIDGINSEGLSVGAFYFIGYAGYMDVKKEDSTNSICSTDLPTYLLSLCKNVQEVKKALSKIKVNDGAYSPAGTENKAVPLHYNIHDAQGNVLVVEYINGELQMNDNPLGVLTNSPEYNWHATNLKNYINLSSLNKVPMVLSNNIDPENPLLIKPTGQGTGFLGIPGDYTPPSRFIRAVAYSHHSKKMESHEGTVLQAFHILNAFDIPLGTIRQIEDKGKLSLEYTQWTVASDLQQAKFYFHTHEDRTIRVIDLAHWDFKNKKIVVIEINQKPTILNAADLPRTEVSAS